MRRALVLAGALLLILGVGLLVGSYLVFNKYSTNGSKHFAYSSNWYFPEEEQTLGLSEGDTLAVETSVKGVGIGSLFIANRPSNKVPLSEIVNRTVYYSIPSDGRYYFVTEVYWVSLPHTLSGGVEVTLNVEVTRKTPDPFFPLLGGIFLLAGAVAFPIAFFKKHRNPRQLTKKENATDLINNEF